jgi:tetratricopeptide (TPR) repeat protein
MFSYRSRFVLTSMAPLAAAMQVQVAFAQPGITPLRASAEYRTTSGDALDDARQRALVEAHRLLWRDAVTRLQGRTDVKSAQLPPTHVAAYTAALLDASEQAAAGGAPSSAAANRVTLTTGMNGTDLVNRMLLLRKDQDATFHLLSAWADLQQLQDPKTFRVRLLTAKAAAAVARTEPSTVGGRAPSADGRTRARALVDEALALAPESPFAHQAFGDLLIDEQKPVEAEAEFRKALAGLPDSSEAHRRLAEAVRLQGDLDEAALELATALRLDPRSARARTDLALVQRGNGQNKQAIVEYREAIRLDPDLIDAHNGLAIALAAEGQRKEAVVEFREMIRIDPDSATAYYNLATVLADLDLDVESAAALREVIRINPNHYNAHYNLGELFRLDGKYDDAAREFREFLRLAPGDTPGGKRNIQRATALVQQFEQETTPPGSPRNTVPDSMSRPAPAR